MLAPAAPADAILAFLEGQQALAIGGGDLDARVAAMASALRENQALVTQLATTMHREVDQVRTLMAQERSLRAAERAALYQLVQEARATVRGAGAPAVEVHSTKPPNTSKLDEVIEECEFFLTGFDSEPTPEEIKPLLFKLEKWLGRLSKAVYVDSPVFTREFLERRALSEAQINMVLNSPYNARLANYYKTLREKMPTYDSSGIRLTKVQSYFLGPAEFERFGALHLEKLEALHSQISEVAKQVAQESSDKLFASVQERCCRTLLENAREGSTLDYLTVEQLLESARELWLDQTTIRFTPADISKTYSELVATSMAMAARPTVVLAGPLKRCGFITHPAVSTCEGFGDVGAGQLLGVGHLEIFWGAVAKIKDAGPGYWITHWFRNLEQEAPNGLRLFDRMIFISPEELEAAKTRAFTDIPEHKFDDGGVFGKLESVEFAALREQNLRRLNKLREETMRRLEENETFTAACQEIKDHWSLLGKLAELNHILLPEDPRLSSPKLSISLDPETPFYNLPEELTYTGGLLSC